MKKYYEKGYKGKCAESRVGNNNKAETKSGDGNGSGVDVLKKSHSISWRRGPCEKADSTRHDNRIMKNQ
jgi:hypothetical protein